MHPRGSFCGGEAKFGLWREVSVGGGVFSLRESRSAQQKGLVVSVRSLKSDTYTSTTLIFTRFFTILSNIIFPPYTHVHPSGLFPSGFPT
jgi:hypothetical protein